MKRQGRSKIECDNYQITVDVGKEVIITVPGWMRFNKIISKYDFTIFIINNISYDLT